MTFQQFLDKIDPKKLFLFDSLGALLSAVLLGLVLTEFESTFGMPRKTLYLLAFIPCIFMVYSFLCFLRFGEKWRFYLKIIAIANLLYCCLTMGLVIYLYQELTVLGILYFVLEMIVVVALAVVELRKAATVV